MTHTPEHTAVYLAEVTRNTTRTSEVRGRPPVVERQLYRALYATPQRGGFAVRTFEVVATDGAEPVKEDEEVCDFPTLAQARDYIDRCAASVASRRRRL